MADETTPERLLRHARLRAFEPLPGTVFYLEEEFPTPSVPERERHVTTPSHLNHLVPPQSQESSCSETESSHSDQAEIDEEREKRGLEDTNRSKTPEIKPPRFSQQPAHSEPIEKDGIHHSSTEQPKDTQSLKTATADMDRNESIIRWSPNLNRDEFLTVNPNFRTIQIYEPTGHARAGQFDYEKISKHNDFPALTAYDWSPKLHQLVAVGTSQGQVHLLRVDDNSNTMLTLPLKLQRTCQAVAFNTDGLLAVGLDRVRNDMCLQIWDINQRLGGWDPSSPGWTNVPNGHTEPINKLEASLAVSSIRFFEDQPKTLVVGIKNQSVRIHDLRDPNSAVMTFQTRCNNNLAIDYSDPNYFASSALDHPGLMIWDRRAVGRSLASPMYLESVDNNEVPWGGALKLDRAIDIEKNAYIRGLRYCRDQRGTLGVLSNTGQFQVIQTIKEFIDPDSKSFGIGDTPELLEVKRSHDLEYSYCNEDHGRRYDERIVAFDWVTLHTSALQARAVTLRANGKINIMEMPGATSDQLLKLVPWSTPRRTNEPLSLMKFADPSEGAKVYGPLITAEANSRIPLFGPDKLTEDNVSTHLQPELYRKLKTTVEPVIDLLASHPASDAEKNDSNAQAGSNAVVAALNTLSISRGTKASSNGKAIEAENGAPIHQHSLGSAHTNMAELMLQRAKDRYFFDCPKNAAIVAGNAALQNVWDWVTGAETAAKDDGMVTMPLDLSFMGVQTIWANSLGAMPHSRVIDTAIVPNLSEWDHLIGTVNKQLALGDYNISVKTAKPHHRKLCLAINTWGKASADFKADLDALETDGQHTCAATWALIEGDPKRAIGILQRAGTDMLFVAMALEIKLQSKADKDLGVDWKNAIDKSPRMNDDPYLRAISSYISTGNWAVVVNEQLLPLRVRVTIALRHLDDSELSDWLKVELEKAIITGNVEGIILTGITDNLVDIFAKYVEKTGDYQTATLVLSFCAPRYIDDIRCAAFRKEYQAFLQRHKEFILRVHFEQGSTKKSRLRDGTPLIKPPPRQVTLRCLKCDSQQANDLDNTGGHNREANGPSTADLRNPLMTSGINAGISCPKCGSHLPRCASCLQIVGQPRSDRPEQSTDPGTRRMANFPSFCLRCNHVMHMDCSVNWFSKHVECAVAECRCQCNYEAAQRRDLG